MASAIQGLTIEIGGNTSKFSAAMKRAQTEARNVAKDLKTVSENLKFDPKNAETLKDKLDLLKEAASNASKKVTIIQKAIAELNKKFTDKSSDEYKQALETLTGQLASAKREQELATQKVKHFGEEADNAKGGVSRLGDIIKGNLISSTIMGGLKGLWNIFKSIASAAWDAAKRVASSVVDLGKESIALASDMNETRSKINAVFGSESQAQIEKWSSTAATKMGMSQQAAQAFAASFGNIYTNMGFTQKESAKLSMNLVQLAADQASFNNLPTEEVLQKIQSGLTGEYESLKSLGIVIKESEVQQRAMNDTGKASAKLLTDQELAMARYELIVEKSSNANGDFARTSDGLANQQKILAAKMDDLKTKIGEALLPVVTELFGKFNEFIDSPAGQELMDKVIEGITKLGEKILEFLNSEDFDNFMGDIIDGIQKVSDWIDEHGDDVKEWFETKLPEALNAAVEAAGWLVEATQNVKEFFDSFSVVEENQEKLQQFALVTGETMKSTSEAVGLFAKENNLSVNDIYNDWSTYAPLIGEKMRLNEDQISQLSETFSTKSDEIKTTTGTMAQKVTDDADAAANGLQAGMTKAGNVDTSALSNKTGEVETFAQRLRTALEGIASGIANYDELSSTWQKEHGGREYGRASGGPVSAGQPYIVGENGWEVFIPSTSGTIMNQQQLQTVNNNSTNNSRSVGGITIVVNGSGLTLDEITQQMGRKMSMAMRAQGVL